MISFDVLPPLRHHGKDAVVEQTQSWFDLYPDGIGYDVHELHVTADGDIGFCSFVYNVTGTRTDGVEVDMWIRATLGCRRVDGIWLITHEHESDPFDPETGEALIGLKPEPPTGR